MLNKVNIHEEENLSNYSRNDSINDKKKEEKTIILLYIVDLKIRMKMII